MEHKNNVYLYWIGYEYKLIEILRDLIYKHSTNGNGYKVNLITALNIKDYIKFIPDYFYDLCPAHQADFVRVSVICDYGGIWLDSDTLIIDKLDSLFDTITNKNGFLIKENNNILCNGIFGSKPNTIFMLEWKSKMLEILNLKKQNIAWTEIGNNLMQTIYNNNISYFDNYEIFNGLDNMYPLDVCEFNYVEEYITKPYLNYQTIVREYQPLVILINCVYKHTEELSKDEIINGNMPLNYFLNKSLENIKSC